MHMLPEIAHICQINRETSWLLKLETKPFKDHAILSVE